MMHRTVALVVLLFSSGPIGAAQCVGDTPAGRLWRANKCQEALPVLRAFRQEIEKPCLELDYMIAKCACSTADYQEIGLAMLIDLLSGKAYEISQADRRVLQLAVVGCVPPSLIAAGKSPGADIPKPIIVMSQKPIPIGPPTVVFREVDGEFGVPDRAVALTPSQERALLKTIEKNENLEGSPKLERYVLQQSIRRNSSLSAIRGMETELETAAAAAISNLPK